MIKKIGLLAGGRSKEREISLRSAENVRKALENLGYSVKVFDTDENLIKDLRTEGIDTVYNALHGRFGEDGTIQGMLELYDISYTGTGVLGSAICMDKAITKQILMQNNIRTPQFFVVEDPAQIIPDIPFPVICKPVSEGSSICVQIIEDKKTLRKYVKENIQEYKRLLIEKYISGKEMTIGVVGTDDPVVLPVLELRPRNRFYDFEAKYTAGMTDFILPAEIPEDVEKNAKEFALKAHECCKCHGVSRVDLIIDSNGNPEVLEINTSPGMTDQSDLPAQAAEYGWSMERLVEEILRSAYE